MTRVVLLLLGCAAAFHDCSQAQSMLNKRRRQRMGGELGGQATCSGGTCLGMRGGPHEGGPASYPVGNSSVGFTTVNSTMTVPGLPKKLDGITYYIWTDIFFGDVGLGKMNQHVLLRSMPTGWRWSLTHPPHAVCAAAHPGVGAGQQLGATRIQTWVAHSRDVGLRRALLFRVVGPRALLCSVRRALPRPGG